MATNVKGWGRCESIEEFQCTVIVQCLFALSVINKLNPWETAGRRPHSPHLRCRFLAQGSSGDQG